MADIHASAIREVDERMAPLKAARRQVEVDREALKADVASKHEELDARAKQLEEARTEARATELTWEAVAADWEAFEGLAAGKN